MAQGRTVAEAILSRAAGRAASAGDVVVCDVDGVMIPDAAAPMTLDCFERMGGTTVHAPEHVVFAMDHYAPAPTAASANHHRRMRRFAERHGIHTCEVGEGIGHQRMIELGRVLPGQLIVGADSHSVTYGALNAFATGVGSSDVAAALITGRVWLRVPHTIRVELVGRLAPGVSAKDVVLHLIERLGTAGAEYASLEFTGPGVTTLDLSERLVLSNMSVELGAKNAVFPVDDVVRQYLAQRAQTAYEPVTAGASAHYADTVRVDLGAVEPSIAAPHEVGAISPVVEARGRRVDMVFVGTCTGGRTSDFHAFWRALDHGGGIAEGVVVVLTPASADVLQELVEDGTLGRLLALGAILTTPGCGACCGTSGPIPEDDMNVLSTGNRNFKGRMGNPQASIYLASPETCGASAAAGTIVDPRGSHA